MKSIIIPSALFLSTLSFGGVDTTFTSLVDFDLARGLTPVGSQKSLRIAKSQEGLNPVFAITTQALSEAIQRHEASDWVNFITLIQAKYFEAKFSWAPEGQDFNHCISNPHVLAFNYPGNPLVYICNLGLTLNHGELAQIFIHEVAHAYGIVNECEATKIEREVMLYSSFGVLYRNGYWTGCGYD